MSARLDCFYADWRIRSGVVTVMHDEGDSPPERLLQAIWLHQRLLRDELKTTEGEPVKILHPGFHNLEGGPDFRQAVVRFGDGPVRTGDIEVDLRSSAWRAHGHDRNPSFGQVLLHVLWEGERGRAGGPPALVLKPVLDAPVGELSIWLATENAEAFPESSMGRCSATFRALPLEKVSEVLFEAARVRLRSKASQFAARAKTAGWEQALWEGLFRALGYRRNVWPMQLLAESKPKWAPTALSPETAEARLLGLSGLLPSELAGIPRANQPYTRTLWDLWWRDRDQLAEWRVPSGLWRLHGLRPANHPQRRLALAAAWVAGTPCATVLQSWCAKDISKTDLVSSVLTQLQPNASEYWARHWTLKSPRLKRSQPLLGESRVTDLAVNTILPWLWARAAAVKNERMQQRIEDRYYAWPAAQDNAVLRLARQRLFGGEHRQAFTGAASQQGMLQIVHDFCDHSNAVCDHCKLPELLADVRNRIDIPSNPV